jgi:integrase
VTEAPKRFRTKKQVDDLKPRTSRYTVRHKDLPGLYLRVSPHDTKTYWAAARNPLGLQKQVKIGPGTMHPDDAKRKAEEAMTRIQYGLPAFEPPPVISDSFKSVAEEYLKRHVDKKGLRSKPEIERILKKYVYPAWEKRPFEDIGRKDVSNLLDRVEDAHGPRQADYVLAIVRGIMAWYAPRTDDYRSPIVPGMGRYSPKDNARDRILDDDEIRLFWKVSEGKGAYSGMIRFALLTGQRRGKIAGMKWEDISEDGVWTIQEDDREKGNAGELKLPKMALDIINAQYEIVGNPYVFGGTGKGVFTGWSPSKLAYDKKILKALKEDADNPKKVKPLAPWVFHDLRRTFRSLLSRAGVQGDIAERVIGHAIQGVEGIYDRHEYADEKAAALKALSKLIGTIINPPSGDNVVRLKKKKA